MTFKLAFVVIFNFKHKFYEEEEPTEEFIRIKPRIWRNHRPQFDRPEEETGPWFLATVWIATSSSRSLRATRTGTRRRWAGFSRSKPHPVSNFSTSLLKFFNLQGGGGEATSRRAGRRRWQCLLRRGDPHPRQTLRRLPKGGPIRTYMTQKQD